MSKKRITITQLAKKLNVSVSTVSKALNDSYEISDKTKKRIQEFAKQQHYFPNIVAKNLKSGKTNNIGIVIPSIQNFFFAQVLEGIEETLSQFNYNGIISLSNESRIKESQTLRTLSNGVVDGFIVAVAEETQITKDYSHFKEVLLYNKPIVMFDRVIKKIKCDKVIVDDFDAVFKTTEEIILKGCKNIMLVSTINNLSVGKSRLDGYKSAIRKHFKRINNNLIILEKDFKINNEIENTLKNHKVDAIIALDEEASYSSLKVVKKINLKIPDSILLIGYLGEKISNNLTPTFSTINQNGFEIGEKAVKLLLNRFKNPQQDFKKLIVPSKINYRETFI